MTSLRGIVSSAHPLASQAGIRTLLAGGNAFDSAVATAAAIGIVEPYMSGLGGMGVATAYVASERRVRTLDFISAIPGCYDPSTKGRKDLRRGPHSVGSPGNLAGWCCLLSAYGRLSREEAFNPAIELARDGYPLTDFNAFVINENLGDCVGDEVWASIYTTDGGVGPEPGWVLRQTDLAETFERIVADGPGYLYGGPLGRNLVERLCKLGGSISVEDLEAVEPRWDDPVSQSYGDFIVHTPPPQSEGFQMLLGLGLLAQSDLASMSPNGIDHLDVVFRAIRLAAEQRILHANASPNEIDEMFGDRSLRVLRERLESSEPIDARTELFGDPEREPTGRGPQHTTSLSVADAEGNVVCITQSLGSPFGAGIAVPRTGVILNNFLNWGDLHPESPNYMAPGAPLSLPIAPSVTTRDGEPVLALGTPGGFGICQTQTQVFLQWAEFGLPIQAAIEAPRGVLRDGTAVDIESRINPETVDALTGRGHDVTLLGEFDHHVGGMQGVARDPVTGALTGGADPRRDGYTIGM